VDINWKHSYKTDLITSKNFFSINFFKKSLSKDHIDEIVNLFTYLMEVNGETFKSEDGVLANLCCTNTEIKGDGTYTEDEFRAWLGGDSRKSFELKFFFRMWKDDFNKIPEGTYHDFTWDMAEFFNDKIHSELFIFLKDVERETSVFFKDIVSTKDFYGDSARKFSKQDYHKMLDVEVMAHYRNQRLQGKIVKGKANAVEIGNIFTEIRFESMWLTYYDSNNEHVSSKVHPEKVDLTFGADKVAIETLGANYFQEYVTYLLSDQRNSKDSSIKENPYIKEYFDYNTSKLVEGPTVEYRKELVVDEDISVFIKIGYVLRIEDEDFLFSIASNPKYSIIVREAALSRIPYERIDQIYNQDKKVQKYIKNMLKDLPQSVRFLSGLSF